MGTQSLSDGSISFNLIYDGLVVAQTLLAGAEDRLAALSIGGENFSYEAFVSSITTDNGQITIDASVMLERANQTIDLTSSNLVTGGIEDIFVLAGSDTSAGAGDDLVIGGLGSDRYEIRTLSEMQMEIL